MRESSKTNTKDLNSTQPRPARTKKTEHPMVREVKNMIMIFAFLFLCMTQPYRAQVLATKSARVIEAEPLWLGRLPSRMEWWTPNPTSRRLMIEKYLLGLLIGRLVEALWSLLLVGPTSSLPRFSILWFKLYWIS